MQVTITMHLLSSTIELKMRKRLSIILCTLDLNHTWHRYSLHTSSYEIAPKPILRSQCSIEHTALVLTLRLRTRQAMEPGAGTKGDPNTGSFSRDHWRTQKSIPCTRLTYRPEECFTFKKEKQTSSILLLRNTFSIVVTENWNRKHFLHNSLSLLLLLLLLAA